MDSSEENEQNDTTSSQLSFIRHPLWNYVIKQKRTTESGGNIPFKCIFCNMQFVGSYSRVKAHLLKMSGKGIRICQSVSNANVVEMRKLEEEDENRMKEATHRSQSNSIPLPRSSASSSHASSSTQGSFSSLLGASISAPISNKRARGQCTLEDAFNKQNRDKADSLLARMFFASGVPFNLSRSPYYQEAISFIAQTPLPGYKPVGYTSLRNKHVEEERANIENLLEPIRSSWEGKGVTIVTDGWSDPQRRPLINFMALNSNGAMFLKAVNCEGETKGSFFIYELMKNVIHEIGASNVVQIITDNASNCKGAGELIEQTYPQIFWTPCVVHTLNLALKSICSPKDTETNSVVFQQLCWISESIAIVIQVKHFIMNHHKRLVLFNRFSDLKFLSIAETRFASAIVTLRRFKKLKTSLQSLVICEEWSSSRGEEHKNAMIIKSRVLDESLWESIEYILEFTDPLYEMIRTCDTDKPSLHLIYSMWDTMLNRIKRVIYVHEMRDENVDIESPFWSIISEILKYRMTKSITLLHAIGHSLNPRAITKKWKDEHPNLPRPDLDPLIVRMRQEFIERYYSDDNTRTEVKQEFCKFLGCYGEFSNRVSVVDRSCLTPIELWYTHGITTPNLLRLALRLFGHVSSSSSCERNWSTYNFIHSTRRNGMTPGRAENLVYIHNNLRLLSRKTPQYADGECKMWDVAGDGFETMDDAGILEIANLSLDEPDFERVIFGEET